MRRAQYRAGKTTKTRVKITCHSDLIRFGHHREVAFTAPPALASIMLHPD
jgi:hypothetical protein